MTVVVGHSGGEAPGGGESGLFIFEEDCDDYDLEADEEEVQPLSLLRNSLLECPYLRLAPQAFHIRGGLRIPSLRRFLLREALLPCSQVRLARPKLGGYAEPLDLGGGLRIALLRGDLGLQTRQPLSLVTFAGLSSRLVLELVDLRDGHYRLALLVGRATDGAWCGVTRV